MTTKHSLALLSLLVLTACGAQTPDVGTGPSSSSAASSAESSAPSSVSAAQPISVVATGLQIPWGIAFLPDGDMLVTERPGRVVRIGSDRKTYPVDGVRHAGEGGLLGIALHPDFASNNRVYLYMTTAEGGLQNKIERYTFANDQLTYERDILAGIPAANNHDGGRIAFGPDGKLYATTGDAQNEPLSQDTQSLAGKILRVNDDGSVPSDNPFGNAVWSYGHRNPQGLAWDDSGQLWATEHGRSGAGSGYDEVNRIAKGGNYGWPEVQGDETRDGMIPPVIHSGASSTWAPASLAFLNGALFFGGLRGETLYEVNAEGAPVLRPYLQNMYGRIREVTVGPDGFLYFTTSNRDGRGRVKEGDDRIVRADPSRL